MSIIRLVPQQVVRVHDKTFPALSQHAGNKANGRSRC